MRASFACELLIIHSYSAGVNTTITFNKAFSSSKKLPVKQGAVIALLFTLISQFEIFISVVFYELATSEDLGMFFLKCCQMPGAVG